MKNGGSEMSNSTFSGDSLRHDRAHVTSPAVSMNAVGSAATPALLAKLAELCRLPYGWDGYRGVAVSRENAHFAAQLLSQIGGAHTPAPAIVPGSAGDLQIEWHTPHGDLELHVVRPYQVHAAVSFAGYDNDVELSLTRDFSEVARWVLIITEAAGAIPAAA